MAYLILLHPPLYQIPLVVDRKIMANSGLLKYLERQSRVIAYKALKNMTTESLKDHQPIECILGNLQENRKKRGS